MFCWLSLSIIDQCVVLLVLFLLVVVVVIGGGKNSFVKGGISDCCGVLARNASVLLCAFVYCIHICDSIVGDDLCWWWCLSWCWLF